MPEQTHSRLDLATEQLDIALLLFLEKQSYVSALTLAGAAEEIFGKALSHQGKQHSLGHKFDAIEPVHQALHRRPLPWAEFIKDENRARNAAKHMASLADATVTMDVEDAALWLIVRACDNFTRLGLPQTEKMAAFDSWFYERVVGV